MPEGRHVKFAWDPLLSYFRESQKNGIHILYYTLFVHRFRSLSVEILFNLANIAAKKRYNTACLVIAFNNHHYDITSIERYVGQSTIAFIYDVAYA